MDTDEFVHAISSIPSFGSPAASPSGERLAFVSDETGQSVVYVQEVATGDRHPAIKDPELAHGGGPLLWLDDDELLFHLGEGGLANRTVAVHRVDGDTETLFSRDQVCLVIAVSPGSKRVLFRSGEGPDDLFEYHFEAAETTRLTETPGRIAEAHYGPGGDRIAYRHSDEGRGKSIHILDRDSGETTPLEIGTESSYTDVEAWNTERNLLLVEDDDHGKRRCGVYDPETDETTWLTDDSEIDAAAAFTPDGERVLANRTTECRLLPVQYDTDTGAVGSFDLPDGFGKVRKLAHTGFISDRELLVTHQTPRQPERLLRYDLVDDEFEPVYDPTPESLERDTFVECAYERIESFDGLELETLLFDAGTRPSPLVVKIHGGPVTQDYRTFDPFTQLFTAAGYSVLKVNYRGSKGRGTQFRRRMIANPNKAQRDVAAVTETVRDRPWVDADRVAAVGDSFGGYSVLMQLALHGEQYTAGVAMSPQTNLETLIEQTMSLDRDIMEKFTGDWEQSTFWEYSPVSHAEEITAPLCLIHGTEDERVPISQTREFAEELEAVGREREPAGTLRVEELVGLSHGLGDPETRKRVYGEYLDFLGEYLG